MAKAAWGKPTIQVAPPDATGKTIPTTGLQTIASIKENSTKLETQDGEKKELKGEGGITLDVRRGASSSTLTTEIFLLKDDVLPQLLKTQTVSVVVTPEDKTTVGLFIPMATVSISQLWSTEEGAAVKVTFEPVLAKEAEGVEAFHFIKNGAIFNPFTGTK